MGVLKRREEDENDARREAEEEEAANGDDDDNGYKVVVLCNYWKCGDEANMVFSCRCQLIGIYFSS